MYTKNVWLETTMTTAQKITSLNNLENLYSEAVSYIAAITHSSLYYTDAQAAALFFTSATDGSGSGLVCETLDGYTADQILAAACPSGSIAIWSGAQAAIPSGWVLCDGISNAPGPNLRGKFVAGAGSSYSIGSTGGAATGTPTGGTVTIAGFTLTGDHLPSHRHAYVDYYGSTECHFLGYYLDGYGHADDHAGKYTDAETSDAHTHAGSSIGWDACSVLPKFWALCFIQKS